MLKISQLHWQYRYQSIQIHNPPDFLVFATWLTKLFGAKIILDLHDLMTEFYMGRFHQDFNSLPVRLIRFQERCACRFAHHVITVSHHWQEALVERGVAADKVSVVMNVADNAIFKPTLLNAVRYQGDNELRLIYHGSVTYRYGLDLVLQALDRLRHEAPDIHLTILGRGDHMNTLIQMTNELDLNDKVTFLQETRPAEELPEIILTADAGIVAYRNDPFTNGLVPTKLMEYAALGMPAIAARTSAIESYFKDTMVEFFSPGNVDDLTRCLLSIYTDRSRLAQLARGAESFNQRYNWSRIGTEYASLVKQLGLGQKLN